MKTGSDLQEATETAQHANSAMRGLGDPAENLEKSALARTIAADNPDNFSLFDLETYVLQSPEFFNLVALDDLLSVQEVSCLASKIARFASNHITQYVIMFALQLVAHEIAFAKIFYCYDGLGHDFLC